MNRVAVMRGCAIVCATGALVVSACGAGSEASRATRQDGDATDTVESDEALDAGRSPEDTMSAEGTDSTPSLPNGESGGEGNPQDAGPDQGETDPETVPDGPGAERCTPVTPGRAPLRRLSNFEYGNTVRDLFGQDDPLSATLPSEPARYSNNVDMQSPSRPLIEQYAEVAKEVVANVLSDADARAEHVPCLENATTDTEASCVRSIIESIGERAFRRPLDAATIDELVQLQSELRQSGTFEDSIASLLEAMLQGPDFLYRLEFGLDDPASCGTARRLSGHEMATRLSYLLWGSMPDPSLEQAAAAGELDSAPGVLAQASRLLQDSHSRAVVRHFFEEYLSLEPEQIAPDPDLFPSFTDSLPELMHEETLGFLEHEVFEGNGSWPSVLTAPYVYVNEELANYYGIEGVSGPEFRVVEVEPDVDHRVGLLTQGSLLIPTSLPGVRRPITRGLFVMSRLFCFPLPYHPPDLPIDVVPGPSASYTTREVLAASTNDPVCGACHELIDPLGFALENYDGAALWREQENGIAIDASARHPFLGDFDGAAELALALSWYEDTHTCFVDNWAEFAHGRKLDPSADMEVLESLRTMFADADYDVKTLLLDTTQTDAFLHLPLPEGTP